MYGFRRGFLFRYKSISTGNFQGEIITDTKKRPQGVRIKHRMKKNSLKMYDKWSVLRVETTINNPREFKIYRKVERCGKLVLVKRGKGNEMGAYG